MTIEQFKERQALINNHVVRTNMTTGNVGNTGNSLEPQIKGSVGTWGRIPPMRPLISRGAIKGFPMAEHRGPPLQQGRLSLYANKMRGLIACPEAPREIVEGPTWEASAWSKERRFWCSSTDCPKPCASERIRRPLSMRNA